MSDISSLTPSLIPQSTGIQGFVVSTRTMEKTITLRLHSIQMSNVTNKPFSRSVAKRESVMALGSIEDLQHHNFRSNAQRKGLVPAIGSLSAHIKGNPLLSGLPELDFPPSSALLAPSFPPFTPYVKTFEVDPENLRPGVTQDLLHADDDARPPDPALTDTRRRAAASMCYALGVTTHAIRSVRNYILSLHNEHGHTQPRQGFRPTSLSTSEPQKRRAFSGTDRTDSLGRIWHAALNVLTLLCELEESARDPLSDSGRGGGRVRRRRGEGAEQWEERLVLGSDRLYEQDIEKQRGVIAGYLDTVDGVLFGGSKSVEAREVREGVAAKTDARARRHSISTQVVPNTEMAASRRSARRVVSANMLDSMRDLVVMEEPEELQTVVEEDGNEDEGDSDDEIYGRRRSPAMGEVECLPRRSAHAHTHAARRVPPRLFDDDVRATSTTLTTVGQYNNEPWRPQDGAATTAGHVQ
ncbi:hypothetical protein EDB84DRAFT_1443752 [Lactarius hengduanensis]|nr:hypothetical protein EDB84DRAFT_1443752 [Lactarius hengduanensis]